MGARRGPAAADAMPSRGYWVKGILTHGPPRDPDPNHQSRAGRADRIT